MLPPLSYATSTLALELFSASLSAKVAAGLPPASEAHQIASAYGQYETEWHGSAANGHGKQKEDPSWLL